MSPGYFRLASGLESYMARGAKRRPGVNPAHFAPPPQPTHLENSGLAPNHPEPVTWLPHLPTKIIT